MKSRRWRRRRQHAEPELNITAFLNLMVILTPFLLVTAVFSRVAILELSLPASGSGQAGAEEALRLEITVRADRFEVANRGGAPLLISRAAQDYNYRSLGEVLKAVKAQYPQHRDAAILLEPEIPYEVLVQVMDTVRVGSVVQPGQVTKVELFPGISVGDAPRRADGA